MNKNDIDFIWQRFSKKYPDIKKSQFKKLLEEYKNIKPFRACENIFDKGQNISEEVHYILRLYTTLKLKEAFEAMKIDLDDPNVKEEFEQGNIGTPGRIAKCWVGGNIDDDTETCSGRFMKPVRIATFPNDSNMKRPITKRVNIAAQCSHHSLAFNTAFDENSYAIISYIPDKFVLGISKLQRLTDYVSRRFWLQEDLTKAIYDEVSKAAQTKNVYVGLFNIKHTCEWIRGARNTEGGFTSEYYDGEYNEDELRKQVNTIR